METMTPSFIGNLDGVTYKVIYKTKDILSNNAIRYDLYKGYVNGEIVSNILPFNAYTKQFTPMSEAHADFLFDKLPFENAYLFQYKIIDLIVDGKKYFPNVNPFGDDNEAEGLLFRIAVWTIYGLIQMECTAKEHVFMRYENNEYILKSVTLPDTESLLNVLESPSPRYYSVVTPIVGGNFHYRHVPHCLQYVNNIKVTHPAAATTMELSKLFAVDHALYYENYTNTEPEESSMLQSDTIFSNNIVIPPEPVNKQSGDIVYENENIPIVKKKKRIKKKIV